MDTPSFIAFFVIIPQKVTTRKETVLTQIQVV